MGPLDLMKPFLASPHNIFLRIEMIYQRVESRNKPIYVNYGLHLCIQLSHLSTEKTLSRISKYPQEFQNTTFIWKYKSHTSKIYWWIACGCRILDSSIRSCYLKSKLGRETDESVIEPLH